MHTLHTLRFIQHIFDRVLLDKMAALDHLAPLVPEDSLVSWDSLDLRVLVWVILTFFKKSICSLYSQIADNQTLIVHFLCIRNFWGQTQCVTVTKHFLSLMITSAPAQGEAGKPGERGVMGAIGATVSSYNFCFPHHSQACLVHSVEVCCLFYCFLYLTIGRSR